MRSELVIFDCDGTLVDSAAMILGSMTAAFTEMDHAPPSGDAIRSIIGLSLDRAVRHLAPELESGEHDNLVAAYKTAFSQFRTNRTHEEPLYAGIAELIDAVEASGAQMAIATGKSMRGMRQLIETHGFAGRFVSVQTADGNPSKPHPEMLYKALADAGVQASSAIMVGDTTFDIEMARAAGVVPVGVAWGFHPTSALEAAGARSIAADADELRRALGL